jgi:3-dehydroquinate synthetase
MLFINYARAETMDDLANSMIDYVNACDATFQLKMTHCRGLVVQKTTNCLRHSLSLLPHKQRKAATEMAKTKLTETSVKTQADVENSFEKMLHDKNQDKEKACQILAEDLTNKRNDRYYEFRNILKEIFPPNKK